MEYNEKNEKKCPKCNEFKDISEFYKDKSRSDGIASYCKICSLKNSSKYQKTDAAKKRQNIRMKELRANPTTGDELRKKHRILKRKQNATPSGKYWNLKGQAKKRGVKFNIDRKEFEKWFSSVDKKCAFCGMDVRFGHNIKNGNNLNHLTIDRMDNSSGYSIDNIVIACRRCNTVKGGWFTYSEMIEIADRYNLKER